MASKGATILITGANSGLGYLTAKLLAESPNNYHIIVTARTIEKATTAVSSLKAETAFTKDNPDPFTPLALDITSDDSITTAVESVRSAHGGKLDVLINNAAIFPREGSARDLWTSTFTTNVVSTAVCADAFVPLLVTSPNPLIIFLSSSLGSLTLAAAAGPHRFDVKAYRASKAALNMLMVEKYKELKGQGVRCWAVDPGVRATNLAGSVERAREMGAPDPVPGAQGVVDVVEGRRDDKVGLHINWEGEVRPW